MARIEIVIEDLPGDKVKVTATPNFETMMAIELSGNRLTSAHGYAFSVLNHIRDLSKSNSSIIRKIPKLIN